MTKESNGDDLLNRLERWRSTQVDESPSEYLLNRTLGQVEATTARQRARRQYVDIVPECTLYEQEIPAYLRRFSPCGQYLLGFGRSNHSLLIFRVKYPAALPEPPLSYIHFFEQAHEVILCGGSENLCRDFLLFTPDGRFMIVASAESSIGTTTATTTMTGDAEQQRYPHSLLTVNTLDEIRFHVIDLRTGRVTDRLKLSQDYVLLSMHAGIAMNGQRLAILSHHHQVIHLIKINQQGRFQNKDIIGHILYKVDREERERITRIEAFEEEPAISPDHPPPLLGIRQRLMAFLYRRALNQEEPVKAVRILYSNWILLESLCMCRVQFLDENHLLIKLCCPEAVGTRLRSHSDSGIQSTAFFIIYCLQDTQIKGFYRSTSPELYETVRDYNDYLRIRNQVDVVAERGLSWQTGPANDLFERQSWERSVQLLTAARPSQGEGYSAKRMLLNLPYPPQSASESPYVDPSLFRFDDRAISALDRQRNAPDHPVRFYSRRSDHLKFKLNSGLDPQTAPAGTNPYRVKKYTQWIFHPWLPLVISSQHTLVRSTTFNIHYRSSLGPGQRDAVNG